MSELVNNEMEQAAEETNAAVDQPTRKAGSDEVNEMIVQLAEQFSNCFFVDDARRRPLKIGIFNDLRSLAPFDRHALRLGLVRYTRSGAYLRACTEGAPRIGLDGNAVGEVTAEQAAHARDVLAERAKKQKARKQKWLERQQAARDKHAVSQAPAQPQCRASLADLRAAAARRRAQQEPFSAADNKASTA